VALHISKCWDLSSKVGYSKEDIWLRNELYGYADQSMSSLDEVEIEKIPRGILSALSKKGEQEPNLEN
jgi:hypothetical protein